MPPNSHEKIKHIKTEKIKTPLKQTWRSWRSKIVKDLFLTSQAVQVVESAVAFALPAIQGATQEKLQARRLSTEKDNSGERYSYINMYSVLKLLDILNYFDT